MTGGRRTALVTGASGGIGRELARLLADDGHDLVLVARGGAAMEELAQELEERHGIEVVVIPKDLGTPGAASEVAENVAARAIEIDVLVNNAGFTMFGRFDQLPEDDLLELLGVNIVALSQLTRRFLPGMVERRRGMVINLASNAAFQPGPLMAAYYASKAYVLNLSLALTEEVRGSGVTVTALCPGPVATGFQARGNIEDSKLVKGRKMPSAPEIAAWGYSIAKAGKPFAVEGARWRAFAFGTRFMPRSAAARFAMKAQERVGH
jgi:short-subunit dehydrogenase